MKTILYAFTNVCFVSDLRLVLFVFHFISINTHIAAFVYMFLLFLTVLNARIYPCNIPIRKCFVSVSCYVLDVMRWYNGITYIRILLLTIRVLFYVLHV